MPPKSRLPRILFLCPTASFLTIRRSVFYSGGYNKPTEVANHLTSSTACEDASMQDEVGLACPLIAVPEGYCRHLFGRLLLRSQSGIEEGLRSRKCCHSRSLAPTELSPGERIILGQIDETQSSLKLFQNCSYARSYFHNYTRVLYSMCR